ncbi:NmrA family NAD(P)-binding protein [Adhaeribacter pallidiroseus]|uniref:NmrA-like domain-containing protein n=1 Tax=Adhaeribacter pallidiroseus TaxID=2072847 RepID=A0A369QEU8_9BACT|nr:NmrA family NAD(P)-binding protein [Adhaeribacter pallidiroseus]RDC63234.1 hypothetical protein AHMF7616_01835 [Adhaeribacter pallidiroseus]
MAATLVTGATGNVGLATLQALQDCLQPGVEILAGVRQEPAPSIFPAGLPLTTVPFDLINPKTYAPAISQADSVFLLLPPGLPNEVNYFEQLLKEAKRHQVQHLVYLSVQGAEKSNFIPHHKIEKLIIASGILYTFLRPSYFMQNFTTVLLPDLRYRQKLYLPADNGLFNLIDVRGIGAVSAKILQNNAPHANRAYELTTPENVTFNQIAQVFSEVLNRKITYHSPALWSFYFRKKKEGLAIAYIFIMMLLHFLPRFQKPPQISNNVQQITGQEPRSLAPFY